VLRSMRALSMEDVVIGQYRGRRTKAAKLPGYLDDKTVPSGRRAPAAGFLLYYLMELSAECSRGRVHGVSGQRCIAGALCTLDVKASRYPHSCLC